jgi:flavin-dependent dehydrogenase
MKVDVAIVGGGPAGCSAALALRAKDHSVAVIDSPSPRAKSTEMAGPALRNRLQRLHAAETLSACDPCFGISSNWGRTAAAIKPSVLDPFGHAWFIHRERFDACLKLAALSTGAIWIEAKARSFDFNKQSVSIETTGHARVQAKWVILATGSPCWAARVTRQNCSTIDNLIAYWAYLPVGLEERLLFVEAADHGWWYVCPRADKDLLACFVTDSASSRSLRVSKLDNWNNSFRRTNFFQRLNSEATATSICAVSSGLAALPRSTGTRWTAVGDAAAKLDPLGGAGLLFALDSAWRGALAVCDALRGNVSGLTRYSSSVRDLIQEFVCQREQQYAIEAASRANPFWTARLRHSNKQIRRTHN